MALTGFREGDQRVGQQMAVGNGSGVIPAVMLVDSTGTEVPAGGTAVAASSGDKANASAAAALPAVSGKTNYLTGFDLTGSGATANSVVLATVTGLLGGTQTYIVVVPAGSGVGLTPLIVKVEPPHPASAANTAITVTLPALGSGSLHACVNVRGILK